MQKQDNDAPKPPPTIQAIQDLVIVNPSEASEHLKVYLENFPDDVEAQLLKAEMCLKWHQNNQYDAASHVLHKIALPEALLERKIALQALAEKEVQRLLDIGRTLLEEKDNIGEASLNFDRALLLAPNDVALIYGCGMSLVKWDGKTKAALARRSRFGSSNSDRVNGQKVWQEAVHKYLKQAIERSNAGDSIYDNAAYHLAKHALHIDNVTLEMIETLNEIPAPTEEMQELMEALSKTITEKALAMVKILLQVDATRKASGLLKLIKNIAPNMPQLPILFAEKYRIAHQAEKAIEQYKRAINIRNRTIEFSFATVLKLQKRLEKMTIACPKCKKRHVPSLKCPTCEHDFENHKPLFTRYEIENLSTLAHIGIAELLHESGHDNEAAKHLEIVISELSEIHSALVGLRVFQSKLLHSDYEIPPLKRILDELDTNQVTQSLLYHIEQLTTTSPELWFELPVATRLRLCRSLCDAGYLRETRTLFNAAFADNMERKSVQAFAQHLESQLKARVEQLYEEAQKEFDNHRPEESIQLSNHALELIPDVTHILLLRGQARFLIEHDAPALDDLYRVLYLTDEPQIDRSAREVIASLLERRWDLQSAHAMLDSIDADDERIKQMRQRLKRREQAEPTIRLQTISKVVTEDTLNLKASDTPYTGATFAIILREVSASTNVQNFRERLLNAGFEFTQILGTFRDMTVDVCFGLRIICHPYPTIPERGTITIALLVQVNAQDAQTCEQQAHQVYRDLMASMPLAQDNIYVFEPVVDEEELQSLLTPFEPAHISEIVRHENDPTDDGLYSVTPFTPGTLDMHNLLWALLRQSQPTMVSIHLKPSHVYTWDQNLAAAAAILTPGLKDSNSIESENLRLEIAEKNMKHMRKRQTHHARMDYLRYAFVLRVNVVGSQGTSRLLPHIAAATFMGPLRDKSDSGGYEIMQAAQGSDWEIAQHNLERIDVAHWGYSTVPLQQCKLRYAVGEKEAAHMFRFPIPHRNGVPGMRLLEGRSVSPPVGMAKSGTVLGVSTARAANTMPMRVVISNADRRRHMYVVGKTGTGKSTLLASMLIQDIAAGKTVCLVDPHGDLVEQVLLRIPEYRMDDVIYINPSDESFPIGLNILNPQNDVDKSKIANNFIGMLQRLYDPHNQAVVGPIFQSMVRNALLAVMDIEGSSLADVYQIMTNIEYIKKFLPQIKDPVIKDFWDQEIKRSDQYSSKWRAEITPYLTSKFSRFVEDPVLRRIVSQSRNSINWFDAIQSRKIILINLAKGHVGAETSQFLGLLILSEVLEAIFRRGNLPESHRSDMSIVIDEVQNYSTPLLSTIISEGRKFGVSLTIANQFLHQLDGGLREAVFGNVGTIAAMRVGVDDAAILARELYPVFSIDDLTNLPRFTTALKLLVNGMATRPFTMRTRLPTEEAHPDRAERIRQMSRERYGTPIALVEQEMAQRFTDLS